MDDRWNDRLSEYLDDELDAADRARMETHLQSCEQCRTDLQALAAVVERARGLSDRAPGTDLWNGILARIGAGTSPAAGKPALRFSFTLPQLVAAGLALMLLSGGMVWLARLGGTRTDFPSIAAEPALPPVSVADGAYDDAIADLQRTVEAGRGRLDLETVRVLEENLAAIDRGIAQCREALAADSSNVYLNTCLAESRARKLELLRRVASIIDTRRDSSSNSADPLPGTAPLEAIGQGKDRGKAKSRN